VHEILYQMYFDRIPHSLFTAL